MSLFDLISGLLEPFFDLVPRIAHRPASNEVMVVDRWLGTVKTQKNPRLYVPALTHIEYYPTHSNPIDCGIQRLTTVDGKSVAVNATCVYRISDPVLLRDVYGSDHEQLIAQAVRSLVCEYVTDHNFSYLPDILDSDQIWNEIVEHLDYAGVELVEFMVEDLQEVFPLSVLQ
jgi:regulator of protease activity HflC (stomatin/prohibitin superfamily)